MIWRVEKVPASRFETATFLRDQVQRMLRLAREAKDPVVMNELLSMAAWMHEKAKALEHPETVEASQSETRGESDVGC
jgi:hypothetical protein